MRTRSGVGDDHEGRGVLQDTLVSARALNDITNPG